MPNLVFKYVQPDGTAVVVADPSSARAWLVEHNEVKGPWGHLFKPATDENVTWPTPWAESQQFS